MKYSHKTSCPCGDYEFNIIYITEGEKIQEFYCPACSALIEDVVIEEDEDE